MTNWEELLHDEIAKRAHELWEQTGRPVGWSERDWLVPERAVRHHLSHRFRPKHA